MHLRSRIGVVVETEAPVVCDYDKGLIRLGIRATPFAYFFTAATDRVTIDLGMAEARYLSSEVAGGFTGVYFGPFAERGAAAEVSSFEIESLARGSVTS